MIMNSVLVLAVPNGELRQLQDPYVAIPCQFVTPVENLFLGHFLYFSSSFVVKPVEVHGHTVGLC